jgi:VWFA-related protein
MTMQITSFSVRIFLFAVLTLLSGIFVISQDAPQKGVSETPIFKANVEIVNAFVTVRDKKGNIIKDLTKNDFTLKEDGRKQTISYFSQETDLPLTIGLIIDTSPSMQAVMQELQKAGRIFLKNMIRPGKDNVFIIKFRDIMGARMSFAGQIELLQGLTSSSEAIEKAANMIARDAVVGKTTNAGFQTMLAESITLASSKILAPLQGRKAIIVIGDGFHLGDYNDLAITSAHEADTMIYSIRIYDPNWARTNNMDPRGALGGLGRGIDGILSGVIGSIAKPQAGGFNPETSKKDLKTLSTKTGGAFFDGSGDKHLPLIFAQIEEELRNQYSLGYEPGKNSNSGFRKIKVDVHTGGATAITREGYYQHKTQ